MLPATGCRAAGEPGSGMSMQNQLSRLRQRLRGCDNLALVDLATRMVLCAATADRVPREQMDQLGENAALLLVGEVAQALARAEGPDSATFAAVILSGAETEVFLRAGASEALCAHGGGALSLEELIDASAPIVAELQDAEGESGAAGDAP